MTRRGRRLLRYALPALIAVVVSTVESGCRDKNQPPTAITTQRADQAVLPPVVLPDLAPLADSVQRQIHERYQQLDQLLTNPRAAATDRAAAYGALGRVLMAAAFNDEAALCYRHAEELSADDPRWPYGVAHASLRKRDRRAAAAAFDRVLRLRPADLPSLVWLGETYLDDEQLDLAQSTFARALAVQPQAAVALFGAGRTALARRAYAEAVEFMERALAADAPATAIHYPLAMAYRGLGDTAKAEAHLRLRGSSSPGLADSLMVPDGELLESGVALERRGMEALKAADFAAAAALFRNGLELSPGDPSLRYWLGASLYAAGNTAAAEQEFLAVVRQSPEFAKAHFSLGAIDDARGRRAEAIERYRAAVRSDPGMPDARLRLAEDLRAGGQLEAALAEYQAVTRLDPAIVESWIGGAQVLAGLRRTAAAQEWLAQARRIHPARPELADLQNRLSASSR